MFLYPMLSHFRAAQWFDKIAWFLLCATIVVVPFVVDSSLANAFVLPKQYWAFGLIAGALIAWVCKVVMLRKAGLYLSRIDTAVGALIISMIVATIFSAARFSSFIGRADYFSLSALFFIMMGFFYFLIIQMCRSLKQWSLLLDVTVLVSLAASVIFLAKALFGFDLFAYWLPDVWNSIDQANSSFGIWLITALLLSAGQMMRRNISIARVALYTATTLLSFVALIILNFGMMWWILLVGATLLLSVGIIFLREVRLPWLSAIFVLLLASAIFIGFGAPRLVATTVPAEVVLNRETSWFLSTESIFSSVKNTIVGNGPGTFGLIFSQYRDPSFNNDPYAWSLRFNQPFSSVFTLIGEGGLLLTLVFIGLVLFVIGIIITTIKKARVEIARRSVVQFFDEGVPPLETPFIASAAVAVPWFVLTVAMVVFYFGAALWFMWWLLLALVMVSIILCNPKMISYKEFVIEDSPEYTLSFSFTLIVVLTAVVVTGVWGARMYLAERAYAGSLRAATLAEAEAGFLKALSYRSNSEVYHAALAQAYLLQATQESRLEKPNVEKIGLLVQKAVSEARSATDNAPRSVVVWENLAVMYENAAALIPEARDWAIKSLLQARSLEPSNPVLLWRLGNNYMQSSNVDEGIKSYQEAIALKQDYVTAYDSLAKAYEQKQENDKALEIYTLLVRAQPSNNDFLFNYARLVYNRGSKDDRALAEEVWVAILEREPNYANALYGLASLYELRGNRSQALDYYKRVLELNPANKDIKAKVDALSR